MLTFLAGTEELGDKLQVYIYSIYISNGFGHSNNFGGKNNPKETRAASSQFVL